MARGEGEEGILVLLDTYSTVRGWSLAVGVYGIGTGISVLYCIGVLCKRVEDHARMDGAEVVAPGCAAGRIFEVVIDARLL